MYSAQLQLKKYGNFINEFHAILTGLQGHTIDPRQRQIVTTVFDDTFEAATLHQIVDSDNKVLSKIILTFATLFDEVKEISQEAQKLLFNFILMDENLAEVELKHEDRERPTQLSEIDFGNILHLLFRIKFFVEYVVQVASETIYQLGALFECEKQFVRTSQSIHFQSVFHYIGELLVEVIRFWEIIKHAGIKNYWPFLKQSLNSVKYNLETFEFKYDFVTVQGVEGILVELEQLLTKNLFEIFTQSVGSLKTHVSPKALGVFSGHFYSFLKTTIADVQKSETTDSENILKVTAMAVVYHHIFGNLEKKFLKNLMEIHLKSPALTILGNILWPVDQFFKANIPTLWKGHERFTGDLEKARKTYLQSHIQTVEKDTRNYFMVVTVWVIEMNDSFKQKLMDLNGMEMRRQSALLLQVSLTSEISHFVHQKSISCENIEKHRTRFYIQFGR